VPGAADAPLTTAEADRLLDAALAPFASLVLAVSGGPDSMALMHLVAEWMRRGTARWRAPLELVHVASVDHGLRSQSAAEASWVAEQAAARGLSCHTLAWLGAKPATRRQAAAREARYLLLADLARTLGLPAPVAIVLAHQADDQAETVLMRLARGSGVDGLSGMRQRRPLAPGCSDIEVVRPFLAITKGRLLATLRAGGVPWLDDPSNGSPDYERTRWRQAAPMLAGLGLDTAALTRTARRLAAASDALEWTTDRLARETLDFHAGACATVAAEPFDAAPLEVRLRLLRRIIHMTGDRAHPPGSQRLEALAARLAAGRSAESPLSATLGGCRFRREPSRIVAFREMGRRGLPEFTLQPGETRLWDDRFRVSAAPSATPVTVRALMRDGLAAVRAKHWAIGELCPAAAVTLPSFWKGEDLLAVPSLGSGSPENLGSYAAEIVA
jgi:tRNA(Ile)-lysidine synthase